ncbi:MAG TPA: hypothetical protein VFJ14_17480, partial [Nocardioidaceae bacterium]|nr:hypothetical protein [Nocardioidaceae bacterium]
MFAAGLLETPWRRFIVADVIAVVLWACYWVGATALLGEAFSDRQWLTILISIGIGVVIGLVAELIRRYAERRGAG